jgi:hypothetical protein
VVDKILAIKTYHPPPMAFSYLVSPEVSLHVFAITADKFGRCSLLSVVFYETKCEA